MIPWKVRSGVHMSELFVAYYRVSTQRQGASGLGLEAQQATVAAFVASRSAALVGAFTEVESGRKSDAERPQLASALLLCRLKRAKLLIAKLDRLARDAHFLLGLEKAGLEFIAADIPHANRLTVGIMALVAEDEARAISARTKAALAARKARGLPLGNPATLQPGNRQTAAAAAAVWSRQAAEHAARVMPLIRGLRAQGYSLNAIARHLEENSVASARGGRWNAARVRWLLTRHEPPA
jgi:DNA invertase Pin-like site-specific DNA recombinase